MFADERDTSAPGKRFPGIKPVPTPTGKPALPAFMRPRAPVQMTMPAPMPALKLKLNLGGLNINKQGGLGGGGGGRSGPAPGR